MGSSSSKPKTESDLPDWSAWITTNWAAWELESPGPEATFSVIGGVLFFMLLQGHGDLIKYGGTALGTALGYATAQGITTLNSGGVLVGMLSATITDIYKHPALCFVWVGGWSVISAISVVAIDLLLFVMGGEVLVGVDPKLVGEIGLGSIGLALVAGILVGFFTLPGAIDLYNDTIGSGSSTASSGIWETLIAGAAAFL